MPEVRPRYTRVVTTRVISVCAAIAAGVLLAACSASMHGPKTPLTTKDLVTRNKPTVVFIQASVALQSGKVEQRAGTGFVVDKAGLVATNFHVIAGAEEVSVRLLDGTTLPVRNVAAADFDRDLAVLTIDVKNLPTASLGNSDEMSAGDRVIAIGNPLGTFDYTVSDGLISSVRPINRQLTMLQISAPISQGSSGGPVFNYYGEVIGVATLIATEGQNLNFAVPINYLRALLANPGPGETMGAFQKRARRFITLRQAAITVDRCGSFVDEGGKPRMIPCHETTLLDDCTGDQLATVYLDINQAIELGAPVYNRGEHEACFVIYRKVADKHLADPSMCQGVRTAFEVGLARVATEGSFTDQAWAIRDTFDGLIRVIGNKVLEAMQKAQPPGG